MKDADKLVETLLGNETTSDGWQAQVTLANRGDEQHEELLNEFIGMLDQLAEKHGVTYSGNSSGGGSLDLDYECPSGEVGQAFLDEVTKVGKRRYRRVFLQTFLDDGIIPEGE